MIQQLRSTTAAAAAATVRVDTGDVRVPSNDDGVLLILREYRGIALRG